MMTGSRPAGAMGRVARLAATLIACTALATVAACSGDAPPPRSPLGGDTATAPAGTATAAGNAPRTPSPSPSPTTGAATPAAPDAPIEVDRELAIGKAIERMAQWLGVDQTALIFNSFEADTFANACLGVSRPGMACAEVITPGARVTLLDRAGASHEVRADAPLQSFAWAPEATATGTVTAIDAAAGTLTVGTDGTTLRLRLAPGTIQDLSLSDIGVGDELSVAFDRSPQANQPDVLVWIAG